MGRLTVLGKVVVIVGALAIVGGGSLAAYRYLAPHEEGIPGFDGNPVSSVPNLPDAASTQAATTVTAPPPPVVVAPEPPAIPVAAAAVLTPAPGPVLDVASLAGSRDAPMPGAALQDLVGRDAACAVDLSAIVADSAR